MYSKTISYEDYNGTERTETFYFNLTEAEFTKMNMSQPGGMEEYIRKIMETQNGEEIIAAFDKMVAASYGEKSLDGRRFVKSPELYKAFSETEAYNKFFLELVTDSKAAADFVNGILSSVIAKLPEDEQKKAKAEIEQKAIESFGNVEPTAVETVN